MMGEANDVQSSPLTFDSSFKYYRHRNLYLMVTNLST